MRQTNIKDLLDIYFLIDNFDIFIHTNTNEKSAQYTTSKQKKVAGLLKKNVFEIVIFDSNSSNARIFNPRFIDNIKNPSINKAYKKSLLVIQVYNEKEKDFVLTQLPTI